MGTGTWILSFCIMAIEVWGSVYTFDTFLGRKKRTPFYQYRFPVYFTMMLTANIAGHWIGMWKLPLFILGYVLLGRMIYQAGWIQGFFFSLLNYCMIFLTDLMIFCLMDLWGMQGGIGAVPAKLSWIVFISIFGSIWKDGADYRELTDREWLKLGLLPLFTLFFIVAMFLRCQEQPEILSICLFLSLGLAAVNFLVIWLLREILERGKKIRMGNESARKTESQLAHYRDMQAVYERQGRKMHDYKNQIRTMQVLLKKGNMQAAAELAERLTESISVEMSAVNTNHPVVNAVLNQKFHAAREQGVSMIFKVGDMSGMRLDGEKTVILLSNLLDNAIHECVKVVKAGRKAVIHIKLVQEGGKIIFSVKNPVVEKVQVTDGIVLDSGGEMHGVGLSNVKAVVEKYGGDFAISCDQEKFQAVVML
ncbi:MAG: GHKL domain-containing protein [Lachnospiraceae bacterium]|nr:GHKL domain-containing protein [Lachnospiraceae bacterium]